MKNQSVKSFLKSNFSSHVCPVRSEADVHSYAMLDDLSGCQYFIYKFGTFPNKLIRETLSEQTSKSNSKFTYEFNNKLLMKDILKKYPDAEINFMSQHRFGEESYEELLDKPDMEHYMICIPELRCVIDSFTRLNGARIYFDNYDLAEKLIKQTYTMRYLTKTPIKSNLEKIYLVQQSSGKFDLYESKIRHMDVDIKRHYNDDFQVYDQKIRQFLNEDSTTGLVILNGLKGTGKTTYIRNLITTIDKKFIYLTKEMAEQIANPAFIQFLSTITGSVLIIEDCENLVKSRSTNVNSGISNLLNMCDGLLSDVFNIKIIVTFNEDIQKIDSALLRKGRLRCRYEFDKLTTEKSNKLLKQLKKNVTTDEPLALCDIFNYGEDNGAKETSKTKLGFK